MEALKVKTIYSASSGSRRPWTGSRVKGSARSALLVWLGVINLLAAGSLYYVTWWQIDGKLRVRLLTTTKLPGVDLDLVAGQLIPPDPKAPRQRTANVATRSASLADDLERQKTQMIKLVGTIIGWGVLATLAACALASSAGALLARVGGWTWRGVGLIMGVGVLGVLGWSISDLWIRYERFVPDLLRMGIGVLVTLAATCSLGLGRGARRLTYLASFLVIVSAAASAVALYVVVHYGTVGPDELPFQLLPTAVLVFAVHSCWGWILLPMASRIRH